MSMLDTLERKALFGLTRWLTLILVLCLVAIIAVCISQGTASWRISDRPVVQAEEVMGAVTGAVKADPDPDEPEVAVKPDAVLATVKLPKVLADLFQQENNRNVLSGWLESIEAKNRQPFIDGMLAAVSLGLERQQQPSEVINAYHQMYLEQVAALEARRKIAEAKQQQAAMIGGGALLLLAVFSLVLVLLAIERNTRKLA